MRYAKLGSIGLLGVTLVLHALAPLVAAQSVPPITTKTAPNRVGINHANPTFTLDVNGTANAPAFRGDGSQLTNVPGASQWTTNGSAIGYVSGNVGIGTTAPVAPLQVGTGASPTAAQGWNRIIGAVPSGVVGISASNYKFVNPATGAWHATIDGGGNAWFAGSVTQSSDARLKDDVRGLDRALDTVLKRRGVSDVWKDTVRGAGRQLGVIAQEVAEIVPELVVTDERGVQSVDYSRLTVILIEAVKAQQAQIDALNARLLRAVSRSDKGEQP